MKALVTSPMRTGSTWVHAVLCELVNPARTDFVGDADEALRIAAEAESCVLKTHLVAFPDLPRLRGRLHTVRVLRNFKDGLVSRALYCRNVRRAQGLPLRDEERASIDACEGLGNLEFLNAFLSRPQPAADWLEEIAIYECGEFDHTFIYEMLLHNAHDQFGVWIERFCPAPASPLAALPAVLLRCSFKRMQAASDPGFIGSTGVGQWMHWLEEPVSRSLDEAYFRLRARARERFRAAAPAREKSLTA